MLTTTKTRQQNPPQKPKVEHGGCSVNQAIKHASSNSNGFLTAFKIT